MSAEPLYGASELKARTLDAGESVRQFDIHAAEVDWNSTWRPVLVSAIGNECLLGMRLLAGYQLRIDVAPGGVVEITPLP